MCVLVWRTVVVPYEGAKHVRLANGGCFTCGRCGLAITFQVTRTSGRSMIEARGRATPATDHDLAKWKAGKCKQS